MSCGGAQCGDNRFEVIGKAKKHLLKATNIEMSPDEMKVADNFLFRCWQMGWLKQYDDSETQPKPFVKKTYPRTKAEAIAEVKGWTCPECGKKGKDLELRFKYNVVEVVCCGEDGETHGSFWVEYDPNLEENKRLTAKELIAAKHELDHCLANMVRNCAPGTMVDDLWNEFVDKVKPPEWYTRPSGGDVDDLVRREACDV